MDSSTHTDGEVQSEDADVIREFNEQSSERFELLVLSEAALIDYAKKAQKDTLKSIKTNDGLVINFATRSPLIIIVIHETTSYVDPRSLVEQVEAQIMSILTAKTLQSVFEERPTFDLKRLLYGSEKLIDATTKLCAFPKKLGWPWVEAFIAVQNSSLSGASSINSVPNSGLPSSSRPHRVLVPVAIIPTSVRDNLHNLIQNVIASNSKNLVFTLLFRVAAKNKTDEKIDSPLYTSSSSHDRRDDTEELVNQDFSSFELLTICNHHDRHKIKIADIHIILALLSGSRAQLASVESLWMPICLPKFNQDAFLHSYISYMNGNKHSIVMMSIDRDEFSQCQKSRNLIEEKLDDLLNDSIQRAKLDYRVSPLIHPSLVQDEQNSVSESLVQAGDIKQDHYHARQLQFLWYQTNKQVVWWQRSQRTSLNHVIYYVARKMLRASLKHLWLKISNDIIFLGWHTPSFQLYAQFDGSVTTVEATDVIQRITNWIKKEEGNFSIKDYR